MFRNEPEEFAKGAEKAVDEKLRNDNWPVYPNYEIAEVREGTKVGSKYIYVPKEVRHSGNKWSYQPLVRGSAEMFLMFANWPTDSEIGLDKYIPGEDLESKRNEKSALEWAHTYGVLGLKFDPIEVNSFSGTFSEVGAAFLGIPEGGGVAGRQKNQACGGYPGEETVERFAREAWDAYLALRLYEAATAEGGPDTAAIESLAPEHRKDTYSFFTDGLGDEGRFWASLMLDDVVHDKLRGRCYPVLHGEPGSYEQGWAFDSLLGAMWLQMMWLLTAETRPRRCDWCRRVIALEEGARSDQRFCRDKGTKNSSKCRQKWNYHEGSGKSSKAARKEDRDRQHRKSDPT